MKRKNGLFLCFAIMVMMAGIVMAGCEKKPAFPSNFKGTWYREGMSVTLTFAKKSLKASNQTAAWNLEYVDGDIYTIKYPGPDGNRSTITIKAEDTNLAINETLLERAFHVGGLRTE